MAGEDGILGELRSTLHEPGASSWARICELLEGVEELELLEQELVPYALGLLVKWPESVERPAPDAWGATILDDEVEAMLRRRHMALMKLASSIKLDGDVRNWKSEAELPWPDTPVPVLWRSLNMYRCHLGPHMLGWLARMAAPDLRELRMHFCFPGAEFAPEQLIALPWWERLARLDADTHSLVEPLLAEAAMPELGVLDLSGLEYFSGLDTEEPAEGLEELLASLEPSRFGSLHTLAMRGCSLGPMEARVLADCENLSGLHELDVTMNLFMGGEGIETLMQSEHLSSSARVFLEMTYEEILE